VRHFGSLNGVASHSGQRTSRGEFVSGDGLRLRTENLPNRSDFEHESRIWKLGRLERVYGGYERCGELYCSAVVVECDCGYYWKFDVLWLAYGEFLKTTQCKIVASEFRLLFFNAGPEAVTEVSTPQTRHNSSRLLEGKKPLM